MNNGRLCTITDINTLWKNEVWQFYVLNNQHKWHMFMSDKMNLHL